MKQFRYIVKTGSVFLCVLLLINSCYYNRSATQYTVDFNLGYINIITDSQLVRESSLLFPPEVPELEGYTFEGWYRVIDGEKKFWNFDTDTVNENMTLFAQFAPITFTICLDANGGVCEISQIQLQYEEDYVFPTPTREGYYFAGWYSGQSKIESSGTWSRFRNNKYHYTARWTTYPLGMTLKFGTYEQDNDFRTDEEPIEWLVIDYRNGKYLVISKYVLDAQPYDAEGITENDWSTCTLRTWLNETFYKIAFSDTEKTYIADSTLADVNTVDRIFLINYPELYHLFLTDDATRGIGTLYAIENGFVASADHEVKDGNAIGYGKFWLRGIGKQFLQSSGQSYNLEKQSSLKAGIRPAMWVSEEVLLNIVKK